MKLVRKTFSTDMKMSPDHGEISVASGIDSWYIVI